MTRSRAPGTNRLQSLHGGPPHVTMRRPRQERHSPRASKRRERMRKRCGPAMTRLGRVSSRQPPLRNRLQRVPKPNTRVLKGRAHALVASWRVHDVRHPAMNESGRDDDARAHATGSRPRVRTTSRRLTTRVSRCGDLGRECEGATRECATLTRERTTFSRERTTLSRERTMLSRECATLTRECATLTRECEGASRGFEGASRACAGRNRSPRPLDMHSTPLRHCVSATLRDNPAFPGQT